MITLESFEKEDFERLINWVNDEETLVQFSGPIFSFPLTIIQLEEYINDKKRLPFKVIDQSNKATIGHAELYSSEDIKTIKICRILIGDPQKRSVGFGQQIINELLKIAFLELGKEKVELNVYDWNTNAIKCYQNVGFIKCQEKTFNSEVGGKVWTAINMTIDKQVWCR
jgi:RimJ/RimL family protein N-acetyltransferase